MGVRTITSYKKLTDYEILTSYNYTVKKFLTLLFVDHSPCFHGYGDVITELPNASGKI